MSDTVAYANPTALNASLAYATVSDPVKKCQYNLTGDEDPVKVVAWQQGKEEDGKKGSTSYLGELVLFITLVVTCSGMVCVFI